VSDEQIHKENEELAVPPGASPQIRKMAMKVRGPVGHFLHLEASGGIVLLIAAAVAIIWANSPWAHSYHDLWHTPLIFAWGSISGSVNLHFIINDGLMTIFFLLVGMEIKREIAEGELSDIRRASLPIAAAVGGMLAPALIFYALNPSPPASGGWGVPMATDIAFAVGVLSLLGKRVPAALRILLLALAIIDDLGAILVIAFFYTADFNFAGLGVAGIGVAVLILWLQVGVRPGPLYLVPLIIIWTGLFVAGIHPTLAGVIVGLATPVKPWLSQEQFMMAAKDAIDDFEACAKREDDQHFLLAPISRLNFAAREALSPVVRGVDEMHIWVAFGIMPLFALANAGVNLGGINFGHPDAWSILIGISVGLAVGKPLGVMLISWLLVKSGLGSLPKGVGWTGILVVGLTAGIGFTMAIFIAELAFKGDELKDLLGLAKLAILIGTAGAAMVGLGLGAMLLKPMSDEIAALSPTDVEQSTEY
jgi:NhaA family Na+:H+ antiporter